MVIPTDDDLYRAVNPHPDAHHLRDDGTLSSTLFQNTNQTDKMSVDWSAKCTPKETRDRALWDIDFVVAITAGIFYELDQTVEFTPVKEWDRTRNPPRPPNPAHCDVIGSKNNVKRREMFLDHSRTIYI